MTRTSIDTLPDEVLATIFKLLAGSLVPANSLDKQPFPVSASRVSRRWCVITLSYPELWTTIRISRHSYTRKLAAVFVRRSASYPLDIIINLEWCICKNGRPFVPAFLSLGKVIAIVGPHVGRWRSIVLRGWARPLEELSTFLRESLVPASRLEYAHLSSAEWYRSGFPLNEPIEIPGSKLHSLRLDCVELSYQSRLGVSLLRDLRRLDLTMQYFDVYGGASFFREIFGPCCRITTLVLRQFAAPRDLNHAIAAPTIKSLAIGFGEDFYFNDLNGMDRIQIFTKTFSFPSLERLEMVVRGFPGMLNSLDHTHPQALAQTSRQPPFPNLHTLRLEGIHITPLKLALLQILSREISALELVNTSGNHHLLSRHNSGTPWPFLQSLTVESTRFLRWLPAFVAMCAALGPGMALDRLMLPPSRITLPPALASISSRGTSRGLIESFGQGFFVDELDLRPVNFEFVEWRNEEPDDPYCASCCYCGGMQSHVRLDEERLQMEIEEGLKARTALVKSSWKEAKKRRRKRFASRAGSRRKGRSAKQSQTDILEDFCVV